MVATLVARPADEIFELDSSNSTALMFQDISSSIEQKDESLGGC